MLSPSEDPAVPLLSPFKRVDSIAEPWLCSLHLVQSSPHNALQHCKAQLWTLDFTRYAEM